MHSWATHCAQKRNPEVARVVHSARLRAVSQNSPRARAQLPVNTSIRNKTCVSFVTNITRPHSPHAHTHSRVMHLRIVTLLALDRTQEFDESRVVNTSSRSHQPILPRAPVVLQEFVAHDAHELLNLLFCQRFRYQVGRFHIRANFSSWQIDLIWMPPVSTGSACQRASLCPGLYG